MPQLNYEQRQRLFNYFSEAHDLLLLEDDFRFIDDLIYSQNSGKPLVCGSLELLQLLLNKEQELHDKTEHWSVLASTSQKIQAIQMVQEMISDYVANDRITGQGLPQFSGGGRDSEP